MFVGWDEINIGCVMWNCFVEIEIIKMKNVIVIFLGFFMEVMNLEFLFCVFRFNK